METNSFVVDSNIFIAFYNQADTYHNDAVDILRDLKNDRLIISPYVIQEVATVLTYRFGIMVAKQFLNDTTSAHNVLIPLVKISDDIQYFSAINKKISFTDASLVNLAKRMNASLLTFDKQMVSLFKKD